MKLELDVQIDEGLSVPVTEAWFRRVVVATLEGVTFASPAELGLLITDDETVRGLNALYRGLDEPTDVLSFAMADALPPGLSNAAGPFLLPPDGQSHLGQVVVSCPRALEQAREQGHSVEQELALLVAHGVLHLLGYDHQDDLSEKAMQAVEQQVLTALGFDG